MPATDAARFLCYLRRRPAARRIVSSDTLRRPFFWSCSPMRRHSATFRRSLCEGTPGIHLHNRMRSVLKLRSRSAGRSRPRRGQLGRCLAIAGAAKNRRHVGPKSSIHAKIQHPETRKPMSCRTSQASFGRNCSQSIFRWLEVCRYLKGASIEGVRQRKRLRVGVAPVWPEF